MSKPVRISDYLAAELEEIAKRENRSLANLVQHLLTQALAAEERTITQTVRVGGESSYVVAQFPTTPAAERERVDPHFKPDFKGGK